MASHDENRLIYTLNLYYIMNFDFAQSAQDLIGSIVGWAPKLVSGLLILIIGFWIIGWIMKVIDRAFKRSEVDQDLRPFLRSIISVLLKVLLIITVAGVVGIEITAFAALIAAAGLAVGMALPRDFGPFCIRCNDSTFQALSSW